MDTPKNLLLTVDDHTLLITINRPQALNALNQETLGELKEAIDQAHQNETIKGIIISGAGEKAFVAGADIKELSSLGHDEALTLAKRGLDIFNRIENSSKPVLAAINGFALGGGCELAMACHIRIAVASARLGQPEVNLGIIPGYGGTQRLTQLVGRGKALELMLTGENISASEAQSIGLVNHVVETQDELMALAKKMMQKIISKGPVAIAHVIRSVNAGFGFEEKGYDMESSCFAACSVTEDFKEGTAAFLEKRKPDFKGR